MPTQTLRFHLRDRTAAAHAALDAAVGDFDSREGYGRYLRRLLDFREPTEAALGAVPLPDFVGDWRPNTIAAAIRADLADLGLPAPAASHRRHDLEEEMRDPSRLVGTLYVLAGSSLGARLLYRRAVALGFSEGFGARHLAEQASDRLGWQRFLAILERNDRIDMEAAVGASTAAFERARSAFTKDFNDF